MELETYFKLYRSRNKGEFWSCIYDMLNYNQAIEILESEHKDHPSDWLRIVKVEHTIEKEYLGNAKQR